ncbi:MAG TPA: cytochrome c, partial [Terriglobia bacterium]|nr:cytochrome c [Terriglobia bacterium]
MRYRGPSLIARIFAGVVWLTPVTLAATYQQQDQGVRLFAENCAACHGTFGEGGSGPDLTNILWQSEVSDSDLERIIRNGVRGTTMPAFGEKLDARASQALIRQIRTLTAHAIQPTTDHKSPLIEVSAGRLAAAGHDAQHWLM